MRTAHSALLMSNCSRITFLSNTLNTLANHRRFDKAFIVWLVKLTPCLKGSIATGITENPMPKNENLTTREQTVLTPIADGYSSKKIATALDTSCRTVETHRQNIRSKLGIESFAELI